MNKTAYLFNVSQTVVFMVMTACTKQGKSLAAKSNSERKTSVFMAVEHRVKSTILCMCLNVTFSLNTRIMWLAINCYLDSQTHASKFPDRFMDSYITENTRAAAVNNLPLTLEVARCFFVCSLTSLIKNPLLRFSNNTNIHKFIELLYILLALYILEII